jgi:hypothetical protein
MWPPLISRIFVTCERLLEGLEPHDEGARDRVAFFRSDSSGPAITLAP